MKKISKILNMALLGASAAGLLATFTACGDDNGSGEFALDDSFEILLDKTAYTYDSKDSLLLVRMPECKESSLGYLVWKEKSDDVDTVKMYEKKSTAYFLYPGSDESIKYGFEGSSFPKGLFYDLGGEKEPLRIAFHMDGKMINDVFQYEGSCLMKSYYSSMLDGNEYLAEADESLSKLYMMFKEDDEAKLDSSEMIDDIRVPECDELTMFDGEVTLKVDYLKESSGQITLGYKGAESCPITFQIRYANNESDCSAAYDDYKSDKAVDEFDFEDYSRVDTYSSYCIEKLVLEFKHNNGILKKEAPADGENLAKNIARAAVNAILPRVRKK